jgi:hypothetical protein
MALFALSHCAPGRISPTIEVLHESLQEPLKSGQILALNLEGTSGDA